MTLFLADIAVYQSDIMLAELDAKGFRGINVKVSHGTTTKAVHPRVQAYVQEARWRSWALSSFHWLDNSADGAEQAAYAYEQMRALGLDVGAAHVVDCEDDANYDVYTRYCDTMVTLLGRPIATYTGDWWWKPRAWQPSPVSPWLHSAPAAGYLDDYPGDTSTAWAGYGGWPELAIMQYRVAPVAGIKISQSAVRSAEIWRAMTGERAMGMDPRTHPRGAPPDFTLPVPNPNPQRITDALWWLRCMRLKLEPLSKDGGILAIKPGYHSYGSRLVDHGVGDARTDHSIRRSPDRVGPWWRDFASAHDWTFDRAHTGNYTEINKYMKRRIDAMRSLTDLRPDDVYAYTIGQLDGDKHVEGWNEYKDEDETGDSSHLWHIHDSFRRGIVGNFWAIWKALTIDMGWTYAEWLESTKTPEKEDDMAVEWTDKPWRSAAPISIADAIQQASNADEALREVKELRKVVDAQGALLAEILLRLPGGPVT